MDFLRQIVEFVLHIDAHLASVLATYGIWTYVILFVIVFCETGLVVTPILPGDSLLFAAGALAAIGAGDALNLAIVLLVLALAAIAGDTVNYWAGSWVGPHAFTRKLPLIKRSHLEQTQTFYARHGGKTIVLARFMPIVRTFAPFVAGIARMHYGHFLTYNVVGGIVWVTLFTIAGYVFGNIPAVKEHFSLVTVAIIVISLAPLLAHSVRNWRGARVVVESDGV